jgi:hypothetical protein
MSVEKATRAELARLPATVAGSALAAAVIVLAQRLDAGPGDAVVAMLVREFRMALAVLHAQGGEQADELDTFLKSISASEFGD